MPVVGHYFISYRAEGISCGTLGSLAGDSNELPVDCVAMATIFIIDDEAILHRLYKDVFAIKGHQVVADAFDGEEAVEKYAKMNPKPDVIILDHRMPNKDGLQAMHDILSLEPNARIVFISADANVREQAIKAGARSFGLKPVTIRHMLDLVEIAATSE